MRKQSAIETGLGRIASTAILVALMLTTVFGKNMFDWRLVMYPNLPIANPDSMKRIVDLLDLMQTNNYNGMYVDGAWLNKIHTQNVIKSKPALKAFLAEATKRKILVVPQSQSQGGNMQMDQNLREALPVVGTPFKVLEGVALVEKDPAVTLANGNFEQPLAGNWTKSGAWEIVPGHREGSPGSTCLRIEDPIEFNRRVRQQISVRRFRTYVLSAYVKVRVDSWVGKKRRIGGEAFFTVEGTTQPWLLKDRNWPGVPADGKFHKIEQKFHSLDNNSVFVNLNATCYWRFRGCVWFDDAAIREVGLYEVSQNPGFGIAVRTSDGDTLKQGTDYVVGNEKLTVPGKSSAKDGDELLVDWATKADVMSKEPEASFCHENVWTSMREQIQLEDEWFNMPGVRYMKYSEWRLGGWDPACQSEYNISGLGSGPYFAGTANKTAELYREINSNRICMVLHDLYSPYHSAKNPYAVANGGILGSGHLLDTSIIVVNWQIGMSTTTNGLKSLLYFAGLDTEADYPQYGGLKTSRHRQILSCNGPGGWNTALERMNLAEKQGLKDGDVIGIGYQMFGKSPGWFLDRIGPMAEACRNAGRWGGTDTIQLPPVSVNPVKHAQKNAGLSLTEISKTVHAQRTFRFAIPKAAHVELSVFNLQGRMIATLLNEQMAANTYERALDASVLGSGVYFAALTVKGQSVQRVTRKIILF